VSTPAIPAGTRAGSYADTGGTEDTGSTESIVRLPGTPTVQRLAALPRSERRDELAALVVAELKTTLLMTGDDELPMDESLFDLGLSSLRLTEVKQRLDVLLGRTISVSSLFNRPTVAALLTHLTDEVLPELFGTPTAAQQAATPTALDRAMVDDLLQDLYQA
jgi:aryl carrier-like protein